MLTRRQALTSSLLGAGYVGLRALATGLPAGLLLHPRRALANMPTAPSNPQYVIFMTSGLGDPINASSPGSYIPGGGVLNTPGGTTTLALGGKSFTAGAAWKGFPTANTSFWHIMTNTPVHPKETDVLKLMDITANDEMFPSLLAKQLAPALGTIQAQPVCIGALSPSEGLTYDGQALPIIPALALKDTLANPTGPLTTPLQKLRDQTLNGLYGLYKDEATAEQKAYIDSIVTSQSQARKLNLNLLDNLSQIQDNTSNSQILAAITLIQMNICPVVSIHIPFGGDNHSDTGLATEISETQSGVASLSYLMSLLEKNGLTDKVSFVSLNVFGRTLASSASANGRQHNPNHQVSIVIGKPFKSGVIGGLNPTPIDGDYGCLSIDPKTGAGTTSTGSGTISPVNTLAAFGQTMLAGMGASSSSLAQNIPGGQVVTAALA
jgi:hypothetical protein